MQPSPTDFQHRGGSSHAFTLVELLVVIGIIAVLIGILMPSLRRARMQANEVQCAANLRSWGQAFQIYANQNRGIFPHSQDEASNPGYLAYTSSTLYPQNDACYDDLIPAVLHIPTWSSYSLYQKPKSGIWQCPLAEPVADGSYDWSASEYGYHSYVMNQYLDTGPLPSYPPFFNSAKARHGSSTLLMFESTLIPLQSYGQSHVQIDCYCGCESAAGPRDLGDRHPHRPGKLGGNLLMLDGHVEWTDRLYDPTLPNPNRPPTTNQLWWPWLPY